MISSYLGTILRAFFVLFSIVLFWYALISFIYIVGTYLVGFEFNLYILNYLFLVFILFRMFYPKNVFK